MGNKKGNRKSVAGRKLKAYGGLDLSNLEYLEHGDLIRVAEKMKKEKGIELNRHYISKVKTLFVKNTGVMVELLKIGGERRKLLENAIA